MSKMEILAELPKLELADRREIFDRICEIEERDLITGGATDEEKALLDRELAEYRQNSEAGSSWNEIEARIRKSPACFSAQII
jgi:putative addiction module component (TIGR02574 family)